MEFCPDCGAILVQEKKKNVCPRCSYSATGKIELTTCEKIEEKKEVVVISEKDTQTNPIIEEKCKECGHNKAYFWITQTRSSDEAATRFFRCTKCDYTWREYN